MPKITVEIDIPHPEQLADHLAAYGLASVADYLASEIASNLEYENVEATVTAKER